MSAMEMDNPMDLWFDGVRLNRHQQLLTMFESLPAEEVLAAIVVLAQLAAFKARSACLCRTAGCAHRADVHTGEGGACQVEGCSCGPGGWS